MAIITLDGALFQALHTAYYLHSLDRSCTSIMSDTGDADINIPELTAEEAKKKVSPASPSGGIFFP